MISQTIKYLEELSKINKIKITPIMSFNSFNLDSKFGDSKDIIKEVEDICQNKVIHTIQDAEPIAPVTMAVKSHLRNSRPVVIAISTNNALSGAAENIGRLLNRKNYYFVPVRQDNPITKPNSLVFDPKLIKSTLEEALDRNQIQPFFL